MNAQLCCTWKHLQAQLAAHPALAAADLSLEILESSALANVERARGVLQDCARGGFRVALDDFGTGYSNLARLRELPVDRVKIDRSLVRDIASSAEARTICSAVVEQVYSGGLQFRTPEAITAVNTYRACHYLRAMAIWGLWATETDWSPIPGSDAR